MHAQSRLRKNNEWFNEILSTIFGIVGIIANTIIFWQNDRKKILLVKLSADIVWSVHYSLIFAWSGAASCGISIIRETVFLNKKHKWARSNRWLAFFVILSICSAVITWQNIINILPATASILSVFSFAIGKPKLTRLFQIFISVLFLIYDIYCLSYPGIINKFCTLGSVVLALRHFGKYKGGCMISHIP